jgi:two-component system, OmpR family, response regulator
VNPRAKRLLLVDDDEELVELLLARLPGYGFEVDTAADAPRGLAKALLGGYDAIILNSVLSGFDAFSLLETLRRQSPSPVIMLCPPLPGMSDPRRRPNAFLPKPFRPEDLARQVQLLVNPKLAAPAA